MDDQPDHVIAHLPFAYHMEYRAPRCRNLSTASVRETASFVIPQAELGKGGIEIARIHPDLPPKPQFGKVMKLPGHTLIANEGRLLRPVVMPDGSQARLDDVAGYEPMPGRKGAFIDYPLEAGLSSDIYGYPTRTEQMALVKDFRRDDRRECLARAQGMAAELLVVEGRLHRPAPEPAIEVIHRSQEEIGGRAVFDAVVVRVVADAAHADERSYVLRADRMDAACAIARAYAARSGCPIVIKGEIEVLRPDLLAVDDRMAVYARFAKDLRKVGSACDTLPIPAVRIWCDAMEAMARFDRGGHSAFDVMMDRVEALLAAVKISSSDRDLQRLDFAAGLMAEVGPPEPLIAPEDEMALSGLAM